MVVGANALAATSGLHPVFDHGVPTGSWSVTAEMADAGAGVGGTAFPELVRDIGARPRLAHGWVGAVEPLPVCRGGGDTTGSSVTGSGETLCA